MYNKTDYEMCVSPHMPSYSTNHNWVQNLVLTGMGPLKLLHLYVT